MLISDWSSDVCSSVLRRLSTQPVKTDLAGVRPGHEPVGDIRNRERPIDQRLSLRQSLGKQRHIVPKLVEKRIPAPAERLKRLLFDDETQIGDEIGREHV